VAALERLDGRLEHIRVLLLGRPRFPFGIGSGRFGPKLVPLFDLNAIEIRAVPHTWDLDNARYLLFECSGGYPIGIFSMYVRSPIAEQGETAPSQLFLIVGFNFYGKEQGWPTKSWINRTWERIHNRVTSNILNRFKQLCEWKFKRAQES
jgi:hypothetical protein